MRLASGRLSGRVRIPGSKSLTNRALVAAALAPGRSELVDPLDCDDTRVLAAALGALGATVRRGARSWIVEGPLTGAPGGERTIDVGPAGTPARFLLALLAALPGRFVLDGSPRMRERPMQPLVEALASLGARIEPLGREGFLPLRVEGGTLGTGTLSIRSDVSSQFVSALLLASPAVAGGLDVRSAGRAASGAYVELTRQVLAVFAPEGRPTPARYAVPADDSAACFPIAGALVSRGRVEIEGLDPASAQPDAVFRRWAADAGGTLRWEGTGEEAVLVVEGSARRGVEADVDPAPDAALPLAALVAFARGASRLRGVARLREKESDRLAAAEDLLVRAGAEARVEAESGEESLLVDGLAGQPVRADFRAWGDHRVAMAAAVLALALPEGSTLDDPGVVSKSYPAFWSDWSSLVSTC
ncbi:MAG: 3-phosphoshikimate 1-carboxyvinyltransferase [Thermoanaerobaculia bacterium]|nr:3-phosphoshikimate 1-carboxyvinyltransferase [Thermoanaerobaculia bacterium]